MILKEEKNKIITEYATHEGDTGSPEVQIAVLTNRINSLTKHMQQNPRTSIPTVVCSRWSVTAETC